VPTQSYVSTKVTKSFCLISILYAVIGDPLVIGSLQVTETLSFKLAVVIEVGEFGTNAHNNVNTPELAE